MASQYAPDPLGVVDLGNAVEFPIEGIAGYAHEDGAFRFAFFSKKLVIEADTGTERPAPLRSEVTVILRCTDQALHTMFRQVAAIIRVADFDRPGSRSSLHA